MIPGEQETRQKIKEVILQIRYTEVLTLASVQSELVAKPHIEQETQKIMLENSSNMN